jgi:aminopeptidase N
MQTELNEFRSDLLTSSIDGGTIDSYGPLSWGYRLEAARNTDTWRVITYEKGAWVFHMLRQRLGDAKFFQLLSELRKRFQYRSASTRDLRVLVKEVGGPTLRGDAVDAFFDSWVQSTGVPNIRVRYSSTGRAPSVRVSGTIVYEDSEARGVHPEFATELPLEFSFANGTKRIEWVKAEEGTQPFSFTLPQAPSKVELLSPATLATGR